MDDAAKQQERERQAEFQDEIRRDRDISSGAAAAVPAPPTEEQAPVSDPQPLDQTQT